MVYNLRMAVKRLLRISYFMMLAVIGALVRIPFKPVPFTLQAVFAVLAGLTIGGTDGAYSQLAYAVFGILGVPVFTAGGGYAYVLEPTFGYVIGLIMGAYVAGVILRRFGTLKLGNIFLSGIAGLTAIYIIGAIYQVLIFTLYLSYPVAEAFKTLLPLPLMFAAHAIIILIIALILPKAKTMIGLYRQEKFKKNASCADCAD